MSEHDNFVAENAASQQELRELLGELSDVDLAHSVGDGWTIATALAHAAFYDFRAAAAANRWRTDAEPIPFPLDAEMENAALEPLLLAIPPRAAARLALQAAEAADSAIASLPAELLARIAVINDSVGMFRSEHRREHMDQIRAALKK
jgi:hypothetical protein